MNGSRIAFRLVVFFAFTGMIELIRIATDGHTSQEAVIIVALMELGLLAGALVLWKRAKNNDKGLL